MIGLERKRISRLQVIPTSIEIILSRFVMILRYFLLCFASLFLLNILSPSATSQTNYPPEEVEKYVRDCTGDRGLSVEAVCRCVIRKAQIEYPDFEEFQTINQDIEETGTIPPPLRQIIDNCETDPFS